MMRCRSWCDPFDRAPLIPGPEAGRGVCLLGEGTGETIGMLAGVAMVAGWAPRQQLPVPPVLWTAPTPTQWAVVALSRPATLSPVVPLLPFPGHANLSSRAPARYQRIRLTVGLGQAIPRAELQRVRLLTGPR